MDRSLKARLINWGEWLAYEIDIGPKSARCISLESRYLPEAGDVWEDDPLPPRIVPDCHDAEVIHKFVQKLPRMERVAIEMAYGGHGVMLKTPRMGEYAFKRLKMNAEILLENLIKSIDIDIKNNYKGG